jgi:D-3-phosphoglycerate dehydrogenase
MAPDDTVGTCCPAIDCWVHSPPVDGRRPKVAILGTRFADFELERAILGDVDLLSGPGRSPQELLEVAQGADVILAGAAPRFDADTLRRLGSRAIVRLGVGVDSVDLEAARRLGMWVAYVPDYGTEAVAFHTLTLILSALRRLPEADRRIRAGEWGFAELRPLHLPSALTVGIIGFGRIGRRVAELLAGVGFEDFVVADPLLHDQGAVSAGVRLASTSEVLAEADVVTLHAPPPGDQPLIGAAELGSMKEGSVLVNTARGSLIDTPALIDALRGGRPSLAAIDVYDPEPPDIAVFEPVADRLILTPHMAWYTEESETELRRQGATEARRILDGQAPLHPVVVPEEAALR